jgi:hypothetical protein
VVDYRNRLTQKQPRKKTKVVTYTLDPQSS